MKIFQKVTLFTFTGLGMAFMGRQLIRNKRKISFNNKAVFITGGSRGLGIIMARLFLEEGAKVAIAARDEGELEKAKEELSEIGTVLVLRCDITKPADIRGAIKVIKKKLGPIDILINNAGKIVVGPIEELEKGIYEEAMNTHFWGPLYTMEAVLPGMEKRGAGRIANIASIAGKLSIPHQVPYSASKAALVGLSTGFRAEYKEKNVFITTVIPGLIRTGAHQNADIKGQHQNEFNWFSIADASVLTSMDAENAAKKILDAIRYGDAELVMPLHARLGMILEGLIPGSVIEIFAEANKFLPSSLGSKTNRKKGKEIQPTKLAEYLSGTGNKAAEQNNEYF